MGRGTTRRVVEGYLAPLVEVLTGTPVLRAFYPSTRLRLVPLPMLRTGRILDPAPLDQVPRPQAPLDVLDQLPVQLLPAEAGSAVEAGQIVDDGRRQQRRVRRPPPGQSDVAAPGELSHQGGRPRSRRHQRPRQGAAPEPEHEIVPGRLGPPPFGELVTPGMIVLGPAQRLRIGPAVDEGPGPVRPAQPSQRRLPVRPLVARSAGEDARGALDHHRPDLVLGRPDQGDSKVRRLGQLEHPLRSRPGLPEAAPGHDHPDPPVAVGRQLGRPSQHLPASRELGPEPRRQAFQEVEPGFGLQHRQPFRERAAGRPLLLAQMGESPDHRSALSHCRPSSG
jgi:hypothetical protein